MLNISPDNSLSNFAFFGTIVGYNFVKFDALVRANKNKMRIQLKVIAVLSFVSLLVVINYYFKLNNTTKISAAFFLILTILYTLPFFSSDKNARNWAGLKIYIVAICWVGVTVILPISNSDIAIIDRFYLIAFQRFLLIFTLILIFEIIDLKTDDTHLKTVPQQIGVKRTKILGYLLLFFYLGLDFFNFNFQFLQFQLNFAIGSIITLFLYFANENRSKYYTSFWVESIPVFWWLTYIFVK